MRWFATCLTLLAWPAVANDVPTSRAGTQFMQQCLLDVTEHRIVTLKRQAPEFAASLSEDELQAGGVFTAQKTCPCFLQVIAVSQGETEQTPEERVSDFLAYLEEIETTSSTPIHPVVPGLTRLCGVRSSILPERWIKN